MNNNLSLTAVFDDICRDMKRILEHSVEEKFIAALKQIETYQTERGYLKNKIEELEMQVRDLAKAFEKEKLALKNVRFSLQKETELKRSAQKQRDVYKNKVQTIAKMFEGNSTPEAIQRQIYSAPNVRNLRQIEEAEETETSMSGTEWERSEDDLDSVTVKNFDGYIKSPTNQANDLDIGSAMDLKEVDVEESFVNVTRLDDHVATDFSKKPASSASLAPSQNSKRSSISSCFSRTSQKSILELKKHEFISKKETGMGIKRNKCNSCHSGIGFLTQCYKCQWCRATVHPECRKNLPLPCLPPVTLPSHPVRFYTIGKLCPKVRPRVPPLLVYCIQELESRNEQLYVNEISETESKKLRDKLMSHTKGAPELKSFSTRQLCGVVKSFLRRLDEPLITTDLWREFTRVATAKDQDDRISLLEDTVDQLPEPNRDTLAFLMKHLQHVVEMGSVGSYHLKKTFGHFIVGNSPMGLSPVEMERHKAIQGKLMTCFMDEYTCNYNGGWEKVLNYESCKEAINDMTCTTDSQCTNEGEIITVIEKNARRRSSVMGGFVTTGPMTPLAQPKYNTLTKPLKPLFNDHWMN